MKLFGRRRTEIDEQVTAYFLPTLDITAFELADLLSYMTLYDPLRYGFSMPKKIFDDMPLAHRRHFSLTTPPGV